MGIADGMKNKPGDGKDFFQTPKPMTRALIDKMLKNKRGHYLDPCCGDGAIIDVFNDEGFNVAGGDIIYGEDFLKAPPITLIDRIIVMNPPYSKKDKFLEQAITWAKEVYCLLPMTVVSYNYFHRDYLESAEYKGRLLMTPKIILSAGLINGGDGFKRGGICTYAWFKFDHKKKHKPGSWEIYANLDNYVK